MDQRKRREDSKGSSSCEARKVEKRCTGQLQQMEPTKKQKIRK